MTIYRRFYHLFLIMFGIHGACYLGTASLFSAYENVIVQETEKHNVEKKQGNYAKPIILVMLALLGGAALDFGIRGKESLIGRQLYDPSSDETDQSIISQGHQDKQKKLQTDLEHTTGERTPEQIKAIMSNQNSPRDAFAIIMGESEQAFDQKLKAAFAKEGKSYPQDLSDTIDLAIKIAPPPAIIMQGEHEVLSIHQLEHACKEQQPFDKSNRKFSIITGSVADLQADKAYRDAVFQVASNSNGIEGSVSYGGSVQGLSARPQGQTATFSTLGRALYSMRYRPKINLKKHYGGKIGDKDAYKNLAIDLHTDIQVTNGESDKGLPNYKNPLQRITQVLTFAYANPHKESQSQVIEAQDYLKAAYRGTLLAAVAKKKKKVVLTLMGGGVFSNPFSWIADALQDTEDLITTYNLDVELVIYDLAQFVNAQATTEQDAFYKAMLALAQKINAVHLES